MWQFVRDLALHILRQLGTRGCGRAVFVAEGDVTLQNTFILETGTPNAVHADSAATIQLACCNLYGNVDGDWVADIAGQLSQEGNMCVEPKLCDPEGGDFHLQSDSPCGPDSSECGLIGAWGVGCSSESS